MFWRSGAVKTCQIPQRQKTLPFYLELVEPFSSVLGAGTGGADGFASPFAFDCGGNGGFLPITGNESFPKT